MTSFLLRALATLSRRSSDGIRLSRGLSSREMTCWLVLISRANSACETCCAFLKKTISCAIFLLASALSKYILNSLSFKCCSICLSRSLFISCPPSIVSSSVLRFLFLSREPLVSFSGKHEVRSFHLSVESISARSSLLSTSSIYLSTGALPDGFRQYLMANFI